AGRLAELVQAVDVRDRGLGDAGAGAAAAGQRESHAGDAGLVGVLDAVAVEVVPHEVANGHRLVEAEVDGLIAAAGGQGARGRAGGADVAIGGRGAFARGGGRVAGRGGDGDGVGAGRLAELVQTVGVRDRGLRDAGAGAAGAGQRESHAGDAGLAS